ncbi:MAG: HAMP domain-containing histidine kinase [bacterium]|nr:HAMP domain-containing histidine kinase [bacterium]
MRKNVRRVEIWFEDLKIRHKLTLSFSIILFLVMVFVYAYFPARQRVSVYKEMNQRVTYLGRSLALACAVAWSEDKYRPLHEIGTWIMKDRNLAYYYIYRYSEQKEHELYDFFPENQIKRKFDHRVKNFLPVRDDNVIEIKVPIDYDDKYWGSIVLAMDLKDVKTAVNRINTASTIILSVVFVIGFLIVMFIASLINKPIRSLMEAVNRIISHGDYSERVRSKTGDEAGVLASRFNDMIEMIEERDLELKQQYEALQEVTKLKDDFLAVTTHDLRSPITAILGFADLLTMDERLDPVDLKRVNHIKSSAEFLANLVSDVLDISRLESGNTQLKLKPLPVSKIIDSSVNTLHYMALPKEIAIRFCDNAQGKDMVKGDSDAMLRVMNNLISNAVKFTPKGGNIDVTLESTAQSVDISVSDTGIGIAEDKIPLLFQTYSPASRKGTDGEKGTGLGLSITRTIVQKHDGDITVNSREEEGTCFTVTIPRIADDKIVN